MIYLAYDHRGYKLAEQLKQYFADNDIEFQAIGSEQYDELDDYTVFAFYANEKVVKSVRNYGVYICGNGVGMCIAANRNRKIRAAICKDANMVKFARQHNNINVLVIGAEYTSLNKAKHLIHTMLDTKFLGGKYLKRVRDLESGAYAELLKEGFEKKEQE